MKTLKELYPEYVEPNGRLLVEFCISNNDMYEDYKSGTMYDEEQGLHLVCNGQYIFKEYLDCERMWNEGIPYENYDYLRSIYAQISLVTNSDVFSWTAGDEECYENELNRFNEIYDMNLISLEEVFYFTQCDEIDQFDGKGLHMSLNLVWYGEML